MKKATIFSVLAGLLLIVLALAFNQPVQAADSMAGCQTQCDKCASVCDKTIAYCKKQGGKHADAAHLKRLEDCAKLCKTSSDFMKRGSDIHNKVCAVCAEACHKCAESCDSLKDKAMKDCADECRKCEESCKKMAS